MNYIPRPYYYCSGSSCNGYYPAYWGCDGDAITVSSRYILLPANVGIVELRLSDNCTAFWSRTTLSVGGYYIGSTLDRQSLTPDYGIVSGAPLGIYDSVHTMMSSSQQNCRTCGTASYTQPPALSYSNCGIFMTK